VLARGIDVVLYFISLFSFPFHLFLYTEAAQPMCMLIIEDDPKLSVSIAKHLRAEGFAVDTAGTGRKGEELVQVNDYDAILLDIMLPQQAGWTTCKNLQSAQAAHTYLDVDGLG
jgi:CheY-like chemotaxis protein